MNHIYWTVSSPHQGSQLEDVLKSDSTQSAVGDKSYTLQVQPVAVSVHTAAQMMGVSEKTMWKLVKEGAFRTRNVGRRILVSVQSLHEFMGDVPRRRVRMRS